MPRPGRFFFYLLSFLALIEAGCRVSGLAFREDHRVEILTPKDESTIRLPINLTWKVKNFKIKVPDGKASPDEGHFAIFIDRSPIPPGKDLAFLARDDPSCLRRSGCPDEAYLRERRIYLTTETSFLIEALPDFRPIGSVGGSGRGGRSGRAVKDRHEVTIVLMDGQNKRIGESAFIVSFAVDRSSS